METMTPKNPESQNCQYVLTLSPEQVLVVEQACELYARLNIGHLETITEKLMNDYSASDYGRRRDTATPNTTPRTTGKRWSPRATGTRCCGTLWPRGMIPTRWMRRAV